MKINGYTIPAVPIALVVAVVVGAVAYGEQQSTVDNHGERIDRLEQTPLKVWEIDTRTAVMQEKSEALTREQRIFRDQTEKSLDRILRKLDE